MVEFKSTEKGVAIVVTLLLSSATHVHEIIREHSKALTPRIKNIIKDFPEVTDVDGEIQDDKEWFRVTFVPKNITVESPLELLRTVDKCVTDTRSVHRAIYDEVQKFLKSLKTEDKADTTESDDVTNQVAETRKFESLGEFLQEVFKDATGMEKGDKITITIELA